MSKFLKIKMLLAFFCAQFIAPSNACFFSEGLNQEEDLPPETARIEIDPHQPALFRCLSLDGGGIRGVYTAQILNELASTLPEGNPICEFFQGGITGTSTGSFISLALAAPSHKNERGEWEAGPYTPKEIIEFYQQVGSNVFKSWTPSNCWSNVTSGYGAGCFSSIKKAAWSLLTCFGCFACNKNCGGLCGPKYSNTPLKKALEEKFGDLRLKDAIVPVQVVAYDISLNRPLYFSSFETPDARFVDVALCSSAAPTYFPAVSVEVGPNVKAHCVDGGIFDNSPVLASLKLGVSSYTFSFKKAPHIDDFSLLSIGTGEMLNSSRYKSLKHAGLLGWASSAVSMSIDGTTQAGQENLRLLFGSIDGDKYYRIQTILTPKLHQMDNPHIRQPLIDKAGLEGKDTLLRFISNHLSSHDDDEDNDALAHQLLNLQELGDAPRITAV